MNNYLDYDDFYEIDNHGDSTGTAIDTFIKIYNRNLENGDKGAIRVIHGRGSTGVGGEIKIRLRTYLMEHSDYLNYKKGEDIDGNEGYTMVYPNLPLPTIPDSLVNKVLNFCSKAPKTEEKILGKFRLHREMDVKATIKQLEKSGLLRSFDKGKYKVYETV